MKTYYVEVPVVVTYLLEKDRSVIQTEEEVYRIEVDAHSLRMTNAAARKSGMSRDRIMIEFATSKIAQRIATDTEKLAQMKKLVEKHQCNILTEVSPNGTIVWPDVI